MSNGSGALIGAAAAAAARQRMLAEEEQIFLSRFIKAEW
jgi:hypothetical protein